MTCPATEECKDKDFETLRMGINLPNKQIILAGAQKALGSHRLLQRVIL